MTRKQYKKKKMVQRNMITKKTIVEQEKEVNAEKENKKNGLKEKE